MAQITIAKTIEVPQAWMEKQNAIKYFGYEGREQSFQKLLAQFKEHDEYKKGYLSPTYKIVLLHINTFEAFLRWVEKNKYKRNKV